MASFQQKLVLDGPQAPDYLRQMGTEVSFEPGEMITKRGDLVEGCHFFVEGLVFAVDYTETEDKLMGLIIDNSMLMNEAAVLLGKSSPMGFQCQLPTTVRFIPRDEFVATCQRDNELLYYMVQLSSLKMLMIKNVYALRARESATWRICNLLLQLADRYGQPQNGGILIEFPLTQQLVSDFIDVNRVTVTKIMKRLKAQNLIHKVDDSYVIPNWDDLVRCKEMSASSCRV